MDHFESPRNAGEIDAPDGRARGENPVCGDDVAVTVRVAEGRVADLRYRAFGCHATVAAMSVLSERMRGRPAAPESVPDAEEIMGWFDRFPSGKAHAADLASGVVRDALRSAR